MQERTKKQPRARPERKATLPVNIKKSRHLPNDQLFVPRDHIVPFRTGVFGLTQTGAVDSDVRVFDEHRNPVYDDRAVILWHDKARRPTFGYFLQQERKVYKDTKRDRRRIAMATEGHLRATATTQMLKGGPGTFQWFDLEPGDVFAVEVGTFLPCRTGGYRSRATA